MALWKLKQRTLGNSSLIYYVKTYNPFNTWNTDLYLTKRRLDLLLLLFVKIGCQCFTAVTSVSQWFHSLVLQVASVLLMLPMLVLHVVSVLVLHSFTGFQCCYCCQCYRLLVLHVVAYANFKLLLCCICSGFGVIYSRNKPKC